LRFDSTKGFDLDQPRDIGGEKGAGNARDPFGVGVSGEQPSWLQTANEPQEVEQSAKESRKPAPKAEIAAPAAKTSHRATRTTFRRGGGWRGRYDAWQAQMSHRLSSLDLTPDLAEDIGSLRWFRGLVTMLVLAALALAFWPQYAPLEARPAMPVSQDVQDELRSQMITPLGLGADSGRRMSAAPSVIPLKNAPERPEVALVATLAKGDSFTRMLIRAGVGRGDARRVSSLVSGTMAVSDIEPGTQVDLLLGRRAGQGSARPLENLSFRAKFDLELQVTRGASGNLALKRKPIRVDNTPLRIRGTVGSSLYRSARAAGAPASAVQEYLRALDGQFDLERNVRETDTFDMILQYSRAATGERRVGKLMYAGIDRGDKPKTQLMRWGKNDKFFEASGVGEQRKGLLAPVPGPISSRFGMRRHPILGYRRMHSGQDYRARTGTPIVAVTSGRVVGAGRMGGCGIAVKLDHGGGLQTRYCHMSRMAVSRGQSVRRGQVIGYVGSTGLSTGPHLHYEMYRNGRAVNPASVSYVTRSQLSGSELANFRSALRKLKQIEPAAALEDLVQVQTESTQPKREIERLGTAPKRANDRSTDAASVLAPETSGSGESE
jgi:murein DD-endopeptidase MepM/ murein hydrolase activator NlpD